MQRPAANRDPVPGTPSRETQQLASVEGTASFNGNSGGGTGASTVTVLAAAILEINTVASAAPGTPSPGLQDTATIVTPPNTPSPTGTLTFRLFGPDDANCNGIQDGTGIAQPVRDDTVTVTGTGPFTSDPFPPTAHGEYRFIVTYTGDNNFDGFVTGCDDPGEQITIAPPQIAIVKTASLPDDPPPPDNGTPPVRLLPGGDFRFRLVISNPSAVTPVTITTLTDNQFGDLLTRPGDNTCDDLAGDTIAPNGSVSCSFVAPVTDGGPGPFTHTNIATVLGTDRFGFTVTDNDDAVVRLIPPPQIAVIKTAALPGDPAPPDNGPTPVRVLPGGDFRYRVTVSNPSAVSPVTITALVDDRFGNLLTRPGDNTCDDLAGDVLLVGESVTCSFLAEVSSAGSVAVNHVNVVTVTGMNEGFTVTDDDDAVVRLIPPPQIAVIKTAALPGDPAPPDNGPAPVRVLPGGDFRYRVTVSNPSAVSPVTITALVDDRFGDLLTRPGDNTCDDLAGDVLLVGESVTCSFLAPVSSAGSVAVNHVNVVTVTGANEGITVTDDDDAVVRLIPPPQIAVIKTAALPADPPPPDNGTAPVRLLPGGDFRFRVTVSNPSGVSPVTITALVDDQFGDLLTRPGDNTCDDLAGDVLLPGGSTSCSFVAPVTDAGPGPFTHTNIVTVTGANEGITVTDNDDAVVRLIPPPQIAVIKTAALPGDPAPPDNGPTPVRVLPGGDFRYRVTVSNPSAVSPVTITALVDDRFGNLLTRPGDNTCDDLAGDVLLVGESVTCSFLAEVASGGTTAVNHINVVTVTGTNEGFTVTDDDDAVVRLIPPPQIAVIKTAALPGDPAPPDNGPAPVRLLPGGDFRYRVTVSNPSAVSPVTITALVDDRFGNLLTRPGDNTCDDLAGDVLAIGESVTCSFLAEVVSAGSGPVTHTNVVTVTGANEGITVTDNDDAVVRLVPPPQIAVIKTASLPADPPPPDNGTAPVRVLPGGDFRFRVTVSNPSAVSPVTITSLVDNQFGDLLTRAGDNTCDDLAGDVLAIGDSVTCSFVAAVTDAGPGPFTHTNVVTVIGTNEGFTVTDNDDAVVRLVPPPQIAVVKTAALPGDPAPPDNGTAPVRLLPGGDFRYRVTVSNPSAVSPVTITTLVDDRFGNLLTRGGDNTCDDLAGDVLAIGESVTCSFVAEVTSAGTGPLTHTNVVTVTGTNEGITVTDEDDAVVRLIPPPQIAVVKTAALPADPPPADNGTAPSLVVPGGDFRYRVDRLEPERGFAGDDHGAGR